MGKVLEFALKKDVVPSTAAERCTLTPTVVVADNVVKVIASPSDVEIFARYGVQGTLTWGDCVFLYMKAEDDPSLDWVFIESLLKLAYAKKVSLDISCGIR